MNRFSFLYVTFISAVIATLSLIPLPIQAMIVFDPTNYGQNLKTAIQTAATFDQLRKAYETQIQQFQTLKSQFNTVTDHYALFEKSLKRLTALKQLLANTEDMINTNLGRSDFSLLPKLDPTKTDYIQKRNTILAEYYYTPQNPEQIEQQFDGDLNGADILILKNQAQKNQRAYEQFLDTVDIQAEQYKAQQKRLQHIEDYQKTLNQLDDHSDLKTAQTTAGELHLALQQNEAILSSLRMIQQEQALQRAKRISSQIEDEENEQKRFFRALQQDDSEYGQSTWGDL